MTEVHRGFGFVEFEDPLDAAEALDNLDDAQLFGRVLKVKLAKPQRPADAVRVGAGGRAEEGGRGGRTPLHRRTQPVLSDASAVQQRSARARM